jgi:transcriptional regulator with XRE-family HTH domain
MDSSPSDNRPRRGQLADAAGISKPYLSQIETGKRKGSTDILSALAKALKVTLEEVIAREAE